MNGKRIRIITRREQCTRHLPLPLSVSACGDKVRYVMPCSTVQNTGICGETAVRRPWAVSGVRERRVPRQRCYGEVRVRRPVNYPTEQYAFMLLLEI